MNFTGVFKHCVVRSCCRWCRNLAAAHSCTVNWPIRRQLPVSTSVWRTRSTTSSRSCCTRRTVSTRHLKTLAKFLTPTVFLTISFGCKNLLNASLTFAWIFINVIFHFFGIVNWLTCLHLWHVYCSNPCSTVNLYSFQSNPPPPFLYKYIFKTCNLATLGPIHFFHAYVNIDPHLFLNFTRRFGSRLNFVLKAVLVLPTDLVIFIYHQWRLRRLTPN